MWRINTENCLKIITRLLDLFLQDTYEKKKKRRNGKLYNNCNQQIRSNIKIIYTAKTKKWRNTKYLDGINEMLRHIKQ